MAAVQYRDEILLTTQKAKPGGKLGQRQKRRKIEEELRNQ